MYDTNEIYHHGVSGMKWGKRNGPPYPLDAQGKADLREQKKLNAKSKEDYKMHKAYNKQRANKAVKRDVAIAMIGGGAIGTLTGGPMAGLASMLASGLATTAFSSAVNAGRNAVNNSNYKKMLLDSQEIKSASEKGKDIITKANSTGENNKKALESSGYKVDNDNLGGDFMTKKKSGVNIHIGISDNMLYDNDYMESAKQLEKHVPKLTSEVDAMAKKDSFIQEHNIKAVPDSHYVVIDGPKFGETGFFGDDGHEYSVYFDPKTGKIQDKKLMMNG